MLKVLLKVVLPSVDMLNALLKVVLPSVDKLKVALPSVDMLNTPPLVLGHGDNRGTGSNFSFTPNDQEGG